MLLFIGFYFEPDPRGLGTHEQLGARPCSMIRWFDLPCPGCGVTTSVTLATHGDFWASFANQPFGFLAFALGALFSLWAPIAHFLGRNLYLDLMRVLSKRVMLGLLLFVLAAWIYKMRLMAD